MLRVGLTGGIGCGKSTVAAMMRELGCTLIEADAIAHKIIESGQSAYDEIVRDFGRQILDEKGKIDRGKLGRIVFEDASKLYCLNEIVHPRVFTEVEREFERLAREKPDGVAVLEAALLVETGYNRKLDRLVVVWCRPDQQMERLLTRGMTAEQARQRISSQIPLEEKRALASDQIDCSNTLQETRKQVEELVKKLKSLAVKAAGAHT